MDPQFSMSIDMRTAMALYKFLEHQHLDPSRQPEIYQLVHRLRAFSEPMTQKEPHVSA